MPANTSPLFGLTPILATVQIATANTNRDGTGTLGTVYTGDTNGTRLDRLTVHATATTAAGLLTLFVYDGTTTRLVYEIAVTAVTAGTTTAAFSAEWVRTDGYPLLVLPSTYVLKAGTTIAQTLNVTAYGASF